MGIFGGTFDPPHTGHVVIAATTVHALGLDRLLVPVAGDPYRKRDAVEAPAADRLALARAAFADLDRVVVDDREIRRGGATYTIDTVEAVAAEVPDAELFVVVGADAAAQVPTWHRAADLARAVTLAVVARDGEAAPEVPGFAVVKIDIVRVDVSSSMIRDRVARAEPIAGLVPPAVIHEVRERRLYTGSR